MPRIEKTHSLDRGLVEAPGHYSVGEPPKLWTAANFLLARAQEFKLIGACSFVGRPGAMALLVALTLVGALSMRELAIAQGAPIPLNQTGAPAGKHYTVTTVNDQPVVPNTSMLFARAHAAAGVDAAAATFCDSAAAKQYNFTLSGPAESPPNASPGTGNGFVILDTTAQTMLVSVSFSGLTANTTAAHIHSATAVPYTGTAGVATTTPSFAGFPLGVSSGTYSKTLDMTLSSSYNPAYITANGGTTATAFAALCAGIDAGKAYFNIHTSTFAGGEIRGFLVAALTPRLYLPVVQR